MKLFTRQKTQTTNDLVKQFLEKNINDTDVQFNTKITDKTFLISFRIGLVAGEYVIRYIALDDLFELSIHVNHKNIDRDTVIGQAKTLESVLHTIVKMHTEN